MGFSQERLEATLQTLLESIPSQMFLRFSLQIFEEVASTNQTLWEAINQGAGEGTVVIALQQTAGKGQWGRKWVSSKGGLYLSVALEPNLAVENAAALTFASAWGIAECLRERGVPVALKWPNDLVIGERKLGGILTETRVHKGKITQAVVGVGINWNNPVPPIGINLQSLLAQQTPPTITCLEMLAALAIKGINSGYQLLVHKGITHLLPKYQSLLINIGQKVVIEGCEGVIIGISATGELRVRLNPNSALASEIFLQPGTISLGYNH